MQFAKKAIGGWPCPRCQKGTLVAGAENEVRITTVESENLYEQVGDPEMLDMSIAVSLECSDSKCKEKAICLANGSPEDVNYWDEEVGDYMADFEVLYRPIYFYPCLRIFKIPEKVPELLQESILVSFQLFFCDPKSALGHLRIALEEMLNLLGVKKYIVKKNRRVRVSLHDRIDMLNAKYQQVKELCFAIKWHGNAGSHSDSQITRNDVLDAYEIFEVILEIIYEEKTRRANQLAKKINKQKGIRKKKPE